MLVSVWHCHQLADVLLGHEVGLRAFNYIMALLLLATIYPVVVGTTG